MANIKLKSVSLDVLPELSDTQAGQLFKAIRIYQMSNEVRMGCARMIEATTDKIPVQDPTQDDGEVVEFLRCIKSPWVRLAFRAVRSQLDDSEPKSKAVTKKTEEEIQKIQKEKTAAFIQKIRDTLPKLEWPDPTSKAEKDFRSNNLNKFWRYWCEPLRANPTRLRWESRESWDIALRILNWFDRARKDPTFNPDPHTEYKDI